MKMKRINPHLYKEQNQNNSIESLLKEKENIEENININVLLLKEINDLIKEKALFSKDLNKYRGCLIGGAIGDALGYPVEFIKSVESIKDIYGENGITRYKLIDGKAIISDDTQMTLFTANALLWGITRFSLKGIAPINKYCIYYAYKNWYNTQVINYDCQLNNDMKISWIADLPELNASRAPGITCLNALNSNQVGSLEEPINNSKGCGGVMRVAPIGLFWGKELIIEEEQYIDTLKKVGVYAAEATALTHGHPLGIIPSYVFAILISILSHSSQATIEDAFNLSMNLYKENFSNQYDKENNKCFISLMEKAVKLAHQNISDIDAIMELGEGWVAEEALAIAIYSCIKYSNDFEKAIVCAVNHGGDSDSTGSIAGNIMGAYLGFDKIPEYYIENLELKDVILELAEDLYIECPINSYVYKKEDEVEDEYWLSKYLYIKRDINLKGKKSFNQKFAYDINYNKIYNSFFMNDVFIDDEHKQRIEDEINSLFNVE